MHLNLLLLGISFKPCLSHGKTIKMSLEDMIIHTMIKEKNENWDKVEKAKEINSKANLI